MKKTFVLYLLLITTIYSQEIVFDTKYIENQKIEQINTIEATSYMNIKGDSSYIKEFEKKGKKLPLNIKHISTTEKHIQTYKKDEKGNIPFDITFKNSETNIIQENKKHKIPSHRDKFVGMTMKSLQKKNGETELLSIDSDKLTKKDKKLINTIFTDVQPIPFQNKKFKIDEKYIDETPITMPINGIDFKLIQKTEYTLKSIEDNIAYFDIIATFNLIADDESNEVNTDINAYGFGKLNYDIKKKIEIENNFTMNVDMTIDAGPVKLIIKSNSIMKLTKKLL